jgi:predicted dehydrogenase
MDRVRLGIAGIGNVSGLNTPGYLEHPGCEVLALCDPRLDKAKAAARDWDVPRVYRSFGELLADDDIDAIEVLTPTHLHAEHVIAAAEAGKHVSCQKPIANTVADARRMIDVCERAGVMFRVTENCCFYPPLQRARDLVRSGDIGDPVAIRIKTVVGETASEFQANLDPEGYVWRFDSRSPGGHLFDDVIHKYAMALWLVDSEVTSVQAVVRKGRLFFEPMVAALEYERDGLLGTMEVSHAPGMFIESDLVRGRRVLRDPGDEGIRVGHAAVRAAAPRPPAARGAERPDPDARHGHRRPVRRELPRLSRRVRRRPAGGDPARPGARGRREGAPAGVRRLSVVERGPARRSRWDRRLRLAAVVAEVEPGADGRRAGPGSPPVGRGCRSRTRGSADHSFPDRQHN